MRIRHTILYIILLPGFIQAQSSLDFGNGNSMEVDISTFDINQHTTDTCELNNTKYICLIDKSPWFGSDIGIGLPEYELSRIIFHHNEQSVELDVSGMYNPTFSGSIDAAHFKVIEYGDKVTIDAWFSDGAGTYCARWQVINGQQLRTLLSQSEGECFN